MARTPAYHRMIASSPGPLSQLFNVARNKARLEAGREGLGTRLATPNYDQVVDKHANI